MYSQQPRILRWQRRLVALALALCLSDTARALPNDVPLDQLHHTAWTLQDGAPTDIWALAETSDGALWLGTVTGLFRFDGDRFERFQHGPHSSLTGIVGGLLATSDGGLWVGMRLGDIFFLRNGEVVAAYSKDSGLPGRTVYGFAVDATGAAWAATVGGLFRLEGSRWHKVGPDWNLTADYFSAIQIDRAGRLWCVGPAGAFVLPPGTRAFRKIYDRDLTGFLAGAPDGTMWYAGSTQLFSLSALLTNPANPLGIEVKAGIGTLLADRDGALWSWLENGLGRLPRASEVLQSTASDKRGQFEQFGVRQGLSGDAALSLLEDSSGNIWVGTNGGLDRFRAPRLRSLDRSRAYEASFAEASDGVVWITTRSGLIDAANPSETVWHSPEIDFTSAHSNADGPLWLGTNRGLYARRNGKVESVPLPVTAPNNQVHAIASAHDGSLWVAFVRSGTYRFLDGSWMKQGGVADLPDETAAALARGASDEMWFGYIANRLVLLRAGRAQLFTAAHGLTVGNVQVILPERQEQAWIGGSGGLNLFKNGRLHVIRGDGAEQFEGTSGIVLANDGSLWLNTASGVVRIGAEQLEAVRANTDHAVTYELFDHNDGLRGTANQLRPVPSAFKDSRGRLWFSTGRSVHWIDPANIPRSKVAPTVEIRSIRANNKTYSAIRRSILPTGTDHLDIDYTALSLSIPEKVRFKYRLEGVDKHWQDAGARRTAFYTNLSHGHYRFNVIAANEDGVWNTTGASLSIVVPPSFYQTRWFAAICIVLIMLIVWHLYRIRARQIAHTVRTRLEARLQERERIARELHDTLLQGTQGLILAFQGIARELPGSDAIRARMERTLDRADDILAEGRDRVHELRAADHVGTGIADALALAAEELQEIRSIEVRSEVSGAPRPLRQTVREQIYQIGREALINAFKHSQATLIHIIVDFQPEFLRLRIQDNGVGATAESLDSQAKDSRHWGVRGMRERTRALGADLNASSAPGEGVAVELRVPAKIAYRDSLRRLPWQRSFLRR